MKEKANKNNNFMNNTKNDEAEQTWNKKMRSVERNEK
jgi:hypothetical protein